MSSQAQFQKARLENLVKLRKVKNLVSVGRKALCAYDSLAVKEAFELRKDQSKIPIFHSEYTPDFTEYQYDLEMHIFLNYAELYKREIELNDKAKNKEKVRLLEEKGPDFGATFFKREEHLANAISIRWPEKILPTGEASTAYALTPWAKDFLYGVSNYTNLVTFGGGGQGKTFSPIAFSILLYDHFFYTKSGAQCSYSTVSKTKLESSIWSHLNKLYTYQTPYKFSKNAGNAIVAGDHTFIRKKEVSAKCGTKLEKISEGGTMKCVLLVQGAKTAKEIDKLTGQHDVQARFYLLDEAQSTGSAPMSAYNNMMLHPKYGWFIMCGNYEKDDDLLGINTIPDSPNGWDDVDETTHMWEGILKSPDSTLGHKSLIIHYNNDLSPAIIGKDKEEMIRKYSKFLPTMEKKKKLYKTKEASETYEAKRFWTGFKFDKDEDEGKEKVITTEILREFNAHEPQDFHTEFIAGSLDSAHSTERDRSIFTVFNIGLDNRGYAIFAPEICYCIPKPSSPLKYYQDTSRMLKEYCDQHGIQSGNSIMDWTQRSGLLEEMIKLGMVFNHIIYQQSPPDKIGPNEITKALERPIEMETVKTFANSFEKDVKIFAHQKVINRITLGAYAFRLYVEAGMFRNINAKLFETVPGSRTFNDEMCLRFFEYTVHYRREQKIRLDEKREFKRKRKFSPDVLDTFFQFCYMAYVIFGIRPGVKGLGNLKKEEKKIVVDNSRWSAMSRFRVKR